MKKVSYYTPDQETELQGFITDVLGNGDDGVIIAGNRGDYVCPDLMAVVTEDGDTCFATCGMGARPMPTVPQCRTELLLYATEEIPRLSEKGTVIMHQLKLLSQYPFQNKTLLTGHIVDACKLFRKTFGFDAFVFLPYDTVETESIGQVQFLMVVPIYREECKYDPSLVIQQLKKQYTSTFYYADSQRQSLKFPEN